MGTCTNYIEQIFFPSLCLITAFYAKDKFEDVSDNDVAFLVPIGESEDG
jgi:hypothetical protein